MLNDATIGALVELLAQCCASFTLTSGGNTWCVTLEFIIPSPACPYKADRLREVDETLSGAVKKAADTLGIIYEG